MRLNKPSVLLLLVALLVGGILIYLATRDRRDRLRHLFSQGVMVYYGPQTNSNFEGAKVLILESENWKPATLRKLQEDGRVVIGYLSIGELAPSVQSRNKYKVLSENPDWNTLRIAPGDLAWRKFVLKKVERARDLGLDGLMLDTVDAVEAHPESAPAMVTLIESIRDEMPNGYLVMNRGFAVLHSVRDQIDGLVFENAHSHDFSPEDEMWVEKTTQELADSSLPVLILNYSEKSDLERTKALAERHGWSYFYAKSLALTDPEPADD